MRKQLLADAWLSAREAREVLYYFIRWGQHSHNHLRELPDSRIEEQLTRFGYNFTGVVAELQKNPHAPIPEFENLLDGGTWELCATEGLEVKHSLIVSGVQFAEVATKDHAVVRRPHIADFSAACEARDHAIASSSFDGFYTALARGFASLEAYMSLRVAVHNATVGPDAQLIEARPKGGFVTFETKIKEWLPRMTGTSVDLSTSSGWTDFLALRKLRNDVVIHPKPGAGMSSLEELAQGLNRFRTGIAMLMFILHQAFRDQPQSSVIRAMLYPTVRVVPRRDGI